MTESTETRSITLERVMPHPPEKIWRALTESKLVDQWLMKNDFEPVVGRKFNFRADPMPPYWNGITDCEVLEVEPNRKLVYTFGASGEEKATGIQTVVTWTLTPVDGGTKVHMEQSGFRADQGRAFSGAQGGWTKMIGVLEQVAAAAS